MRAGRLGLAVGAVVLIAAAALATLYFRGGQDTTLGKIKDRNMLIVLAKVDSSCKVIAIEGARAFRKETAVWRIFDACGFGDRAVRINFKGSNSSQYPYPDAKGPIHSGKFDAAKHDVRLRVEIQDFKKETLPKCGTEETDKCWWFDYAVEVQDAASGNWLPIADPRLEVDP